MNFLIACLETCLLFVLNLAFLCIILKNRKQQTPIKYFIIMVAGMACAFIVAAYLDITQMVLKWELCYITSYCLLTLLLCKLLFRCSVQETIFLYFVVQSYLDNCFILTKILQGYWLQYYYNTSDSYNLAYALVLLSTLPVILYFIKKKMIPLIDDTENMNFWRYIWAIPVSFYLVYRIGISHKYIRLDTIWDQTQISVPLFWTIATFLSYLMIISMPLEVARHVQYKDKLETLNQLLLFQGQHFNKLSASMEETRQIRHNLKHHMMALAGYAEKGEIDELKKYLKVYMDISNTEEYIPLCSNSAIDSILHHYIDIANRAGIKTTVKTEILESLPCYETDVCVILGNLLENAADACLRQTEGERFINVKINTGNQNMVVILVTNSYNSDIISSEDGFLSAKRNYKSPGLGISSIKKIADKWNGSASFEHYGHIFTAKILLMGPC